MRERAHRIGATLKLFSRAEAGTEVELAIPGHIAYRNPTRSLRRRLASLWSRKRPSTSNEVSKYPNLP
jgi:hypothetical protein